MTGQEGEILTVGFVGAGRIGFPMVRRLVLAGHRVRVAARSESVRAANIGVVAEAVRLAGELGVDEGTVLAGLEHGSGASRALAGVVRAGSVARFGHNVGEFVGKDVGVVRDVAAELGADLGVLRGAHGVLADLLAPQHHAQLLGEQPPSSASSPTSPAPPAPARTFASLEL